VGWIHVAQDTHKANEWTSSPLTVGNKSENFPVHAMKAHGSRRTALIILNFGTRWRWVVNITPRPLYPRQKPLQFTGEYTGCAPKPVWTIWRQKQNLNTARIRTPGRPPPSIYRRRYLGSKGGEFPDRLSQYHHLRGTALNADSHTATRNDTSANRRSKVSL